MIKTLRDGYEIETMDGRTVVINSCTAFEIMNAVDRTYHKEDVIECLRHENIDVDKVTDEEIEDIIDEYEDRLGDDDSWSFILRDIIYNYQFNYKNGEE